MRDASGHGRDWPVRPLRAIAEVRLGRQRSPDRAEGPNLVPYLRAANVKDGRLDLNDIKEMDFTPAEQVMFALNPGDVLVTEGAGSLAAVGASAVWSGEVKGTVCFQNTLLRLRPLPGNDPRFLMWWARHAYGSGLFAAASGGANIYHLGAETLRTLPAAVPPLHAQRAIADYLDAEIARIDGLVAANDLRLNLLAERKMRQVSLAVAADATVPVRRVVIALTSGPRGWSGLEVDEAGPLFLRIANVPADAIDLRFDTVSYLAPQQGPEADRCRAIAGDVLTTITAAIGQVAIVPEHLGDAYISQHLALMRPDLNMVRPEWLAWALKADDAQWQFDMARYGGTKQQLALDDVAEFAFP